MTTYEARIHSLNPFLHSPSGGTQFPAFTVPTPPGFGNYISNPVIIAPAIFPGVLDHQGHIVPQSKLEPILKDVASRIAGFHKGEALDFFQLRGLLTRLENGPNGLYLQEVFNYAAFLIECGLKPGDLVNIEPIAPKGNTLEQIKESKADLVFKRINGFLSIMVWNPVNLCRAPSDNHRKQPPGDRVDNQVIRRICSQKGALCGKELEQAFAAVSTDSSEPGIRNFICACNSSLYLLMREPIGYYQFPWKNDPGADPGEIKLNPIFPE